MNRGADAALNILDVLAEGMNGHLNEVLATRGISKTI